MKKRLFVILSVLCIGSVFTGCSFGREEESTETEVAEDTTEIISVSIDDGNSLMNMTRSELNALTPEQIKNLVETQLPNYREIYVIDEDRVMSDDDWDQLRDIIVLQLFGPEEIEEKMNVDTSEIPEAKDDPNAIYYAPTKEYLDNLSIQEFAEYLNEMYAYIEGADASSAVDFTTLDEETLLEKKKELYSTFGFDGHINIEE